MKVIRLSLFLIFFMTGNTVFAQNLDGPIIILVGSNIEAYKTAAKGAEESLIGNRTETYVLNDDPDRIIHTMEKIALVSPRAVVAIGSQAILALRTRPINAPVTFCLVVNQDEGLEIPKSWAISMHLPPQEAYERIRQVLPKRKIAIPYNPNRIGTLVKGLVSYFKNTSIELVPIIVHNPSELAPALNSMRSQFNALWILPDASFIDSLSVQYLIDYSMSERLPILGYSEAFSKNGAVLSLAGNYEDMGRQAAETTIKVLSGEKQARIQSPRRISTFVNVRVAQILNVQIGETLLALADQIFPSDPTLRMP